jgi:CubicO group peptidase (beta-lactamase class C family)
LPDDGLAAIDDWPVDHVAAAWRRVDGTTARRGETERVFLLASVTKLLTATAVLVAVQEELLDLDEPAGPAGSTVRLLLAHASGLPFDGDRAVGPPATRRMYGNPAFELLGHLVAERAEMPFAEYLTVGVLEPLGMTSTELRGSPAYAASSTVEDLLRFMAELQTPGRVLAPELLAEATTPQLPELDGILPGYGRQRPNPWGLGFELHGAKSPHWMPASASPATFGHFGQRGAFLWVDPVAGVGCVALADRAFGEWAIEAWPVLGEAVLRSAAVG